jgi:hypothetical protein
VLVIAVVKVVLIKANYNENRISTKNGKIEITMEETGIVTFLHKYQNKLLSPLDKHGHHYTNVRRIAVQGTNIVKILR